MDILSRNKGLVSGFVDIYGLLGHCSLKNLKKNYIEYNVVKVGIFNQKHYGEAVFSTIYPQYMDNISGYILTEPIAGGGLCRFTP